MSSPPRTHHHMRGMAGSPPYARRLSAAPGSVPRGFLASPKPKRRPVEDLSVRELRDLHERNARILASPAPSTSTYVERVAAEQAAVESRLLDLVGVESIRRTLETTQIGEGKKDDNMAMDLSEPPLARAIGAKQRALARYAPQSSPTHGTAVGGNADFTFQEAMRLEQEALAADRKRQEEVVEKRRRMGLPIKGEVLTREQQEARIWAYMNQKPSDSDLEDEEDDDDDEVDPSTWFEDDQDDGRKGQDIIEPDFDDDLANIIRVDESRLPGVFS